MTTSPHKADILSSSLEAFKKIQQERASMFTANDVKILGPACPNFQSVDKSADNVDLRTRMGRVDLHQPTMVKIIKQTVSQA